MAVQKGVCLIALSVAFLSTQGCQGPLPGLIASRNDPAWSEPTWGEPAEGLQCRLRPDKRLWQADEIPTFKIDIKNLGRRMFAFPSAHLSQICKIEFDGTWYHWPGPVMIDSSVWPLAPGLQFDDITLTLHRQFGIHVTPGKHTVRAAFSLEGIEVVSNPVGLRVLPIDPKNR